MALVDPRAAALAGQTGTDVFASTASTLAQGVIEAVNAGASRVLGQIQVFAEALYARTANPADLETAHRDIGLAAQQTVLASYDQVVTAREGPASRGGYRAGAGRHAGGVLRRALRSPNFFVATPQGIDFVNVDMLDLEASHWHRLNFGAAPAGSGSHSTYAAYWGGLVIAALGYDQPPSNAFTLPRGFWISAEGKVQRGSFLRRGQDAFYPAGGSRFGPAKVATKGIVARNFLDAGLVRIANELGPAYDGLYHKWWDEASANAGPLAGVVTVLPAPAFLPSRAFPTRVRPRGI